jgi:hypothetical protein
MNDDNESKRRVRNPSEALHHPAKKPAAKDEVKKDVTDADDSRDNDEHGGSERDTMTPGGRR